MAVADAKERKFSAMLFKKRHSPRPTRDDTVTQHRILSLSPPSPGFFNPLRPIQPRQPVQPLEIVGRADQRHSSFTFASPRSRNHRNPITLLMIQNTGSTVCCRNLYFCFPAAVASR